MGAIPAPTPPRDTRPENPRYDCHVARTPTTRPSLLVRLKDVSDQEAWHEFDRRYGALLAAYARGRGLQPADAEDIRQLALAKLAKSLPHFDYRPERGRFRSFLWRVVRGEMIRYIERHKRGSSRVVLGELGGELDESADEIWEREWMRHHFRRAWERVAESVEPRSLEVFRRLLAGVPPARVASDLGLTDAAVRKVKQRIRTRLETLIREQIRDEDA